MKRSIKVVLGLFLAVAIAAGSFYGGMVYGKGQAQAAFPGSPDGTGDWVPLGEGMPADMAGAVPGARGQRGATAGQGGMLSGEILSVGDEELTIEDASGEQIRIHVTDTTLIQKQADVTVADLEEGETVIVSGSQGADGSITARMVQVSSVGGLGMPGNLPFGGQPGAESGGTNP